MLAVFSRKRLRNSEQLSSVAIGKIGVLTDRPALSALYMAQWLPWHLEIR